MDAQASANKPSPVYTSPAPFPGVWLSIAWLLLYFALQISLGFITIAIAVATDVKSWDALDQVAALDEAGFAAKFGLPIIIGVLLAGLVMMAILWRQLRKEARHKAIGLFAPSKLSLWKTIGLGLALMVAVLLIGEAYSRYIVPGKEMQAMVNQLIAGIPKTPLNHLLLFATIAILAPALEELLFRGYLQTALMRHMKPWAAIATASVIFAVLHLQPLALPLLALLGAVFGYLYYVTGSLKVNIILHVLNNAAAYILMALGLSKGV